jgi:hypothetical protein
MFIKNEDLIKLPVSILINYEKTNYRIFLSDNSLTCYLCKSQENIASQCLNQNDSNINVENKCLPIPTSASTPNIKIPKALNLEITKFITNLIKKINKQKNNKKKKIKK